MAEVTEAMWGGLARDIMMWLDFDDKTPRALFQHLKRTGREIPQWLRDEPEMQALDHVPSKGTRCVIIYRAMEDARQSVAGDDVERVTLVECPVGLFWSDHELCLKTEYGNNEGRIDAYIVSTGEFFWGNAPQTIASQRAQLVTPIDTDAALTALQVTEGDKLLNWLGENVGMELSWGEIDGDLSECAWQVHLRQGGTNDREWNLIATGETPLAALQLARSQYNKVSKP